MTVKADNGSIETIRPKRLDEGHLNAFEAGYPDGTSGVLPDMTQGTQEELEGMKDVSGLRVWFYLLTTGVLSHMRECDLIDWKYVSRSRPTPTPTRALDCFRSRLRQLQVYLPCAIHALSYTLEYWATAAS